MKTVTCIIALILGNYLYEILSGDYRFSVAFEHSYFQATALIIYQVMFNKSWGMWKS